MGGLGFPSREKAGDGMIGTGSFEIQAQRNREGEVPPEPNATAYPRTLPKFGRFTDPSTQLRYQLFCSSADGLLWDVRWSIQVSCFTSIFVITQLRIEVFEIKVIGIGFCLAF